MADVSKIKLGSTSYAVKDGSAVSSIKRSGTTFTATRRDGTTFTFTQQDNDTTTGTTYTAGNVPENTTFGTNGSIKNAYDSLDGRLSALGQIYTSSPYTGQIVANGYASKLTLPEGIWLLTTNGYAYTVDGDNPIPFGMSVGPTGTIDVKGWNPCWHLSLSGSSDIYIRNILGGAINCVNVYIQAVRITV